MTTNQGSRWVSLRTCVQTDYISQNLMLFWKLDSCRKSLKIGVERQRQDDVQTGDKVQVKQTLISPSFLTPPPPRNRHERSHFYINLTFRMLFNIHFQSFNLKWPSQIRDHSLFMPRGSGWQKGGGLIQKFRNEGEAGGGGRSLKVEM